MKKTLLLLAALLSVASLQAKKPYSGYGYKIVLTIEGNHDSVMYLGNYYAGGTYASDTAFRDAKGRFVFERKDRRVFPGMYFFTNPAGRHVDFCIYNEEPNFTFSTREEDWTRHMQVKGSKENTIFFAYHRLSATYYARIDSAAAKKTDDEAFRQFRGQVMRQLDQAKLDIIERNPSSFVSLLMNATREPDVPRVTPQGDTLSRMQAWEYYMNHYFDYMRLDDDAIVRTPAAIFKDRILSYLDHNLKYAEPELLCEYIDKMVERARPSKEAYKWIVHTVTEKYLQSNVMSYDAVYVHMVKKYYANGNYWSSPSTVEQNVKRANTWERLLIGKTAIDLVLKDDLGQFHQLHAQPHKYELLVFWSPSCGHCKTVVPALYQKYLALKQAGVDIGAFTILSEPDDVNIPKWRTFIEENHMTDPDWLNLNGAEANVDWHEVYDIETTPQIYLLDRHKVILAKKLNAETFDMAIRQLEGIE